MFEYKGYAGTIEPDDSVFIGRVAGLKDVVTFEGSSFAEVEAAFRDSIDDYLAFCAVGGEAPDRRLILPEQGIPQPRPPSRA